jgi:small-conductance mechanosensitive channel
VENIGLKTTRIRSLGGEQLVFGNGDLLRSRISNYKRMQERRVAFRFGVIYQTTPAQLRRIPPILRGVIQELHTGMLPSWNKTIAAATGIGDGGKATRFDRAHFAGFGDSSLDFEVVYYALTADYNVYMDIQQEINLAMMEQFAELGVEFAYPTRTLYMETTGKPDEEAAA